MFLSASFMLLTIGYKKINILDLNKQIICSIIDFITKNENTIKRFNIIQTNNLIPTSIYSRICTSRGMIKNYLQIKH